jgi:hypothetical protein
MPTKWDGRRFDVVLRFNRTSPEAPWSFRSSIESRRACRGKKLVSREECVSERPKVSSRRQFRRAFDAKTLILMKVVLPAVKAGRGLIRVPEKRSLKCGTVREWHFRTKYRSLFYEDLSISVAKATPLTRWLGTGPLERGAGFFFISFLALANILFGFQLRSHCSRSSLSIE